MGIGRVAFITVGRCRKDSAMEILVDDSRRSVTSPSGRLSCLHRVDNHPWMAESPIPASVPRPTLWSLFSSFVIVSIFGFGGTLAWARRMAVDERRWMSAIEFNEVFALCQFLP